jgi:hypothetical protein
MKPFEKLEYGDIVLIPYYPLKTILGISFTDSNNESYIQECVIEKYWESDVSIQTSHKVILTPLDKEFASEKLYVMDFKTIYSQYNS